MVKRCCIKKCNNESYGGISFHSFPLLEEVKKKWLDVVPVSQKITKDSVVCSLHFKPVDFHNVNSRQMLKADVVPSIFPVTCTVRLQPLPTKTTVRAAGQPRDVPIKVISSSAPKFLVKRDLDLNSVTTEIKSETDPIEPKENPQSEDTLSLAVDTDQPNENLIPLINAHVSPSNAPDPLSDTVRAGNGSAELTGNQADKIIQLTERCAQDSQKLRSLVELVRQRDKTISELRTEVKELMNYIAKCSWEASSKIDASNARKRVTKEHNRHVLIVKRDLSPVSAQPTSDIQTSTVGVKQTDVLNTSDNRQKSSIGIKRTVDIREKSSVGIPGSSDILQESSVGVLNIPDNRKTSVGVKRTSSIF